MLWVASSGGHLSELCRIEQSVDACDQSLWVTFDTEQSRACLSGRRRKFVEYVSPRDVTGALRAAGQIAPLLRREPFDLCVSTGAALATAILPMVALAGIPTYYVESMTRTTGPSLTGKLMARAPRVHTLAQYPSWSSKRWPFTGSLLDDWHALGEPVPPRPLRILVTLGTIRPYRFDRAVNAVLDVLDEGDEVAWQLGCTTRPELPGQVHTEMSPTLLSELAQQADVVVAHAGVGSVLQLFECGISPLLAVRESRFGEHIDNHQRGFAADTASRGLTSLFDLSRPSRSALLHAAGRSVHADRHSQLLTLAGATTRRRTR